MFGYFFNVTSALEQQVQFLDSNNKIHEYNISCLCSKHHEPDCITLVPFSICAC